MSGVESIFQQPWVTRAGWTLVHFLWQGSVIAILLAVVRAFAGRRLTARGRYALSCSALAIMTAAPLATFLAAASLDAAALPRPALQVAGGETWDRVLPWLVVVWLTGVIVFSARLAAGWRMASRLRRAAAGPVPREWQQALDELIHRMRVSAPVRLLASALAPAPAVVGWLRPAILMPVEAMAGLPIEQIRALLAHELAHILRQDYLVNILQSIAEAVLFYHPAVWWVSGQIRMERELCCDDLAVEASGDVLTYATALADLDGRRRARLRAVLAADGGSLVQRIRRLAGESEPVSHTLPGPGAVWALTILWLAGIGAVALHAGETPPAHVALRPFAPRGFTAAPPLALPAPPAITGSPASPLLAALLFDPLFAPPQAPAPPADVTVTLAAKDGRTQFRLGEPVKVELRFQSSAPGKYQVWTNGLMRTARVPEYERFVADPGDGAVDPLADSYEQWSAEAAVGPMPLAPVGDMPVVVDLSLNEWLSIRRPGRYRITAETTRVVGWGAQGPPAARAGAVQIPNGRVPLRSSALMIEVVAPEPNWPEEQLKQAVMVLERPEPPMPRIGQPSDPRARASFQLDAEDAARVLRFLETQEAAQAMVRLFVKPSWTRDQTQLQAGLWATPYRKEVIAAMEQALAAPDVPVTVNFKAVLTQLKWTVSLGPMPTSDPAPKGADAMGRWIREVQMPYMERGKPIEDGVTSLLSEAVGGKRGEALAISLETLVARGVAAPTATAVNALVANFSSLPENSQYMFLTQNWYRIGSPAMEPTLLSLAGSSSLLRDAALARLREMDAEAARKIILERVRRADISRDAYHDDRVLLQLPEETLPELDDVLAGLAEQRRYGAETLLARYASAAIYPRVVAYFEKRPLCSAPLFAYLFRVDAGAAAERLARLRSGNRIGCALAPLSPNEDSLMSPGLEKQAIEDLAAASPAEVRAAQSLLQYGGSAAAKPALLEAMSRWRDAGAQPDLNGVELGFTEALLNGAGWALTQEDADKVFAACGTDTCRQRVTSVRGQYQPPLRVSSDLGMNGLAYARVGMCMLRSPKQLQQKVAQFPKGTRFYLQGIYPGSWFGERRAAEIRRILDAAGAEVVEAPPRPGPTP